MPDTLIASEALYGFCGWLTTAKRRVVIGRRYDAAPIAELIDEFCKANNLAEPRPNWQEQLVHPKEKR